MKHMKLSKRFEILQGRRRELGLILGFAIVAGLILGFGLLTEEVLEGDTEAFDRTVAAALRSAGDSHDPIGPPWLEEFARDVTALGSFAFIGLLTFGVIGYFLLIQRRGWAVLVAASVLGGAAISTLLKNVFDRARPDLPSSVRVFTASFPSGHATLSAISFLTLGALLAQTSPDPRVKTYFAILAIVPTVAVGTSRVYLGVHFASDVLAGWCVGSAWALLCWMVARWLKHA
ncbi:phosphatase PAP2 family protein [Dongia sedimenti]|uniref:Phosphatase PAP2 family protein n=1 Tax=Dongia sedimenti TaxID=3064282 RepID=A0ABU0YI41_9PROT|nr:phosphatase PAP2 family protein [Rhodospirillaceae bacterium R-7]